MQIKNDSQKLNIRNNQKVINDKKYVPKDFKEVAQGMEKQFLEFLISQMKKTIQRSDGPSTARDYYEGLITSERAQRMVETNEGIGIQDVILNQIYPKKFRNEQAFNAYNSHFNNQNVIKQKPKH